MLKTKTTKPKKSFPCSGAQRSKRSSRSFFSWKRVVRQRAAYENVRSRLSSPDVSFLSLHFCAVRASCFLPLFCCSPAAFNDFIFVFIAFPCRHSCRNDYALLRGCSTSFKYPRGLRTPAVIARCCRGKYDVVGIPWNNLHLTWQFTFVNKRMKLLESTWLCKELLESCKLWGTKQPWLTKESVARLYCLLIVTDKSGCWPDPVGFEIQHQTDRTTTPRQPDGSLMNPIQSLAMIDKATDDEHENASREKLAASVSHGDGAGNQSENAKKHLVKLKTSSNFHKSGFRLAY